MTIPTQVNQLKIQTVDTADPIDLTSDDGALYFLNNSDLRVKYVDSAGNETDWFIGDDFSISGDGAIGEGVLTPISDTEEGGHLCIWRETPLLQEADYEEDDGFPAEVHERAMDRMVLMIQDLARLISRAVRLCACDPPLAPLPCGTDPTAVFGDAVTGSIVQMTVEFDGNGSALEAGTKVKQFIGFPCRAVGWVLQGYLLDEAEEADDPAIVLDVRMKAFAVDDPPVGANSIVGATPPAMTAHTDYSSTALVGWTTPIVANTAVEIEIISVTNLKFLTFNLLLRRGAPLDG